jgi:hypothetical protein
MVIVLASSAVDRGFKPRSGQTKDHKIGICYFSTKHAALRRQRRKTIWLEIRIMCPNMTICLFVDCFFSELVLYKFYQRVGLVQSGPHHHLIEN